MSHLDRILYMFIAYHIISSVDRRSICTGLCTSSMQIHCRQAVLQAIISTSIMNISLSLYIYIYIHTYTYTYIYIYTYSYIHINTTYVYSYVLCLLVIWICTLACRSTAGRRSCGRLRRHPNGVKTNSNSNRVMNIVIVIVAVTIVIIVIVILIVFASTASVPFSSPNGVNI